MSTLGTWRALHAILLSLGLGLATLMGASYARAADLTGADRAPDALQQPAVTVNQAPTIRVIYDDNGIRPENRDVVRLIRESGAFQRMADWTNARVALPFPLEIRVTDNLPNGVEVATAELDGRTIYYPAGFLTQTREILVDYVADVLREGNPPSAIPREKFNADDLTVWANEFILGHELGHALNHQLMVPLTGLEEDAADGFALFSTLNGPDGPGPALGAATLFDEMAIRLGALTFEDYSSDHPVVQQRIYNFICYVVASDPDRLGHSLVVEGYLPEDRAIMCPLAWAQLRYGWWTVLEPHIVPAFRAQAAQAREQAHQDVRAEERTLTELLRR